MDSPGPEQDRGVLTLMQKPIDCCEHDGGVLSSEHSSICTPSPAYPAEYSLCVLHKKASLAIPGVGVSHILPLLFPVGRRASGGRNEE